MAKAKEIALNQDQTTKLLEWQKSSIELSNIKDKEFALRQQIVKDFGFDPSKLEGTESIAIGQGWKLKATKTQTYKLTNEAGETERLLAAIAALDHGLAVGLVSWKPDMSTKTYKQLLEQLQRTDVEVPLIEAIKATLAVALTIKPGAPQLELVPPEPPKSEIPIDPPPQQV